MRLKIANEEIQIIDRELSKYLKDLEPRVIEEYIEKGGFKESIHSFHGILGRYKPTYIDLVKSKFLSPKELIASWLNGLNESLKNPIPANIVLQKMLACENSKKYIFIFLERDYYRHLRKRRRNKPSTNFYSIWFGDNIINWGILIQPRLINDQWVNKIPSIEKVPFNYWTIGHVINTGFVDPENNELIKFRSVEQLLDFIKGVLKRLSRSPYEKKIYDLYIEYIVNSEFPEDVFCTRKLTPYGTRKLTPPAVG